MKGNVKVQRDEKDIILKGLRKYGRRAYDAALANGVSVTVLRGNNICRIEPNGEVAKVAKVSQTKYKVSQKIFRLK